MNPITKHFKMKHKKNRPYFVDEYIISSKIYLKNRQFYDTIVLVNFRKKVFI